MAASEGGSRVQRLGVPAGGRLPGVAQTALRLGMYAVLLPAGIAYTGYYLRLTDLALGASVACCAVLSVAVVVLLAHNRVVATMRRDLAGRDRLLMRHAESPERAPCNGACVSVLREPVDRDLAHSVLERLENEHPDAHEEVGLLRKLLLGRGGGGGSR